MVWGCHCISSTYTGPAATNADILVATGVTCAHRNRNSRAHKTKSCTIGENGHKYEYTDAYVWKSRQKKKKKKKKNKKNKNKNKNKKEEEKKKKEKKY